MAKTIAVSLVGAVTKSIVTKDGKAVTKYGGKIYGVSESEITIKFVDEPAEVFSFAEFTTQFTQLDAATLADYLMTNAYFA